MKLYVQIRNVDWIHTKEGEAYILINNTTMMPLNPVMSNCFIDPSLMEPEEFNEYFKEVEIKKDDDIDKLKGKLLMESPSIKDAIHDYKISLVESYIKGTLSEKDNIAVEKALEADPLMKAEYELRKSTGNTAWVGEYGRKN